MKATPYTENTLIRIALGKERRDKNLNSEEFKLPSTKLLSYKAPFYLKFGSAILLFLVAVIIAFLWTNILVRINDAKQDLSSTAQRVMNTSAVNFSTEIIQIINFTKQTNILLSQKIKYGGKDFLSSMEFNQIYLGTQGLSLYVLDDKGNSIAHSPNSPVINFKPEEINNEEPMLLSVKEGMIILFMTPRLEDQKNLYMAYLVPKKNLLTLAKRVLPFLSGHITVATVPVLYLNLGTQALEPEEDLPLTGLGHINKYNVKTSANTSEVMAEFDKRDRLTTQGIIASSIFMVLLSFAGVWGIRRLKANEEKLHDILYMDPLTQVPNKTAFNKSLGDLIADNNKNLGLLLINIDNFHDINKSWGHASGDVILKQLAKRISASVRSSDIVFRTNGDEFSVLLPTIIDEKQAIVIAQRMLEAMELSFKLGGREVEASVSMGLALYPMQAKNAANLIRFADIALHRAKNAGKNTFNVYSEPKLESPEKNNLLD